MANVKELCVYFRGAAAAIRTSLVDRTMRTESFERSTALHEIIHSTVRTTVCLVSTHRLNGIAVVYCALL